MTDIVPWLCSVHTEVRKLMLGGPLCEEAADEIERLRGLLRRHHELRGKPASEEWVDGGPTYRLAMQLWRDTAAALAGATVQPTGVLAAHCIEAACRDAERYRWLRDSHADVVDDALIDRAGRMAMRR